MQDIQQIEYFESNDSYFKDIEPVSFFSDTGMVTYEDKAWYEYFRKKRIR